VLVVTLVLLLGPLAEDWQEELRTCFKVPWA
jgi:hypothetical protein